MTAFINLDIFRDIFFVAVRCMAALGGFVVGYFLSGPFILVVARLITRKEMPSWALAWCRVLCGILAAILVFWLVPIGGWGGPGGGGKGTGGGTGDATGKGKGDGTSTITGKGFGTPATIGTGKGVDENGVLVIEMLGPDTAVEDKCYLVGRQPPPVNFPTMKAHVESNRQAVKAMQIVFTEQSVSRNDPVVTKLLELAREQGLPPPAIKTIGEKKK